MMERLDLAFAEALSALAGALEKEHHAADPDTFPETRQLLRRMAMACMRASEELRDQ